MSKLRLRKVIMAIMISCVALGLTGCGDPKIEAFLKTDIVNAMTSRVNANKAIVNKLFVSGLISTSEKATIEKNIDDQMGVYLSSDLATNTTLQEKLLASIVDWTAPAWRDYGPITGSGDKAVNAAGYTEDDWNNQIVTTYIKNKGYESKFKIPLFKGKNALVEPISIIDGKTGEMINKRFGYKVFVLKPFTNTNNVSKSLDEILEMVNAATSDKKKIDNSVLDQLFQKATDENGKDVTLLDVTQRKNQVVADSIGSPLVTDSKYSLVKGELKQTTVGNKVINGIKANNNHFSTPDAVAQPGNEMVVKDSTGLVPLMAVRFNEFNSDAVDNIIKTLGMSPDQYLFTTYGGENRVYIMEYPVNYVSAIKDKTGDINSYECEFAKSNMGINIRTGKLIKYGTAYGVDTDPGVYFEDSEPYLSVKGAKNAQDEGQSAFAIEGETPDNAKLEVGENKSKVKTGRIILRDYLEATYAPGIVSGENMVVFGRKLRILAFEGSKNNVVAKYYDKEGKVIDKSPSLMIDDFADFPSLNDSKPSIKYVGRVGETNTKTDTDNNGTTPPATPATPTTPTDYATDTIKDSLAKIDDLKTSVVPKIEPSSQFPGTKLGVIDNNKSNKPLFYAITVKKNMFDTALFSGWINNTDTTKNSLNWWQQWLANSNRGYQYKINKTTLEEYLMGNYTFELQKAGVIILDLETVNKIQQEYTKQDKNDSMKWFRTTFVVLGWGVISYAFILLIAWVVDTNVDLGFNILEKLSFGHWVAIKDMEEMPYTDLGERKYIIFQSLIFKTLGISIVGVLLILVNVVDVVVYLIDIFGGIAKMIGRLITGI